jgi:hypothetical protein
MTFSAADHFKSPIAVPDEGARLGKLVMFRPSYAAILPPALVRRKTGFL